MTVAIDTVGTDEALDTSVAVVADRDRVATIAGFGRAGELGIKALGGGPGADPGTAVREAARAQLAELASDGTLDVRVARTYPLADVAEAHRDGHGGTLRGEARAGALTGSRASQKGSGGGVSLISRRWCSSSSRSPALVASSTSSGTRTRIRIAWTPLSRTGRSGRASAPTMGSLSVLASDDCVTPGTVLDWRTGRYPRFRTRR